MAAAPAKKASPVNGIRFSRPPSCSMLRVPVACATAPAPMNSRPLNSAWFSTCSRAPAKPKAATAGD
ncbi:MAG: hypothetical protein BWX54_01190 [Verrucomicrobia bacterium ADurb.Bin018]|nr:MAG: hypothetical protein BWX54_01190 [Verrucomicrobia bacterium ADurb.Bin018]